MGDFVTGFFRGAYFILNAKIRLRYKMPFNVRSWLSFKKPTWEIEPELGTVHLHFKFWHQVFFSFSFFDNRGQQKMSKRCRNMSIFHALKWFWSTFWTFSLYHVNSLNLFLLHWVRLLETQVKITNRADFKDKFVPLYFTL